MCTSQIGAARCERCASSATTIALWVIARLFDLALLAGLIWLSLRAAHAWGRYTPSNDAGAVDTDLVSRRWLGGAHGTPSAGGGGIKPFDGIELDAAAAAAGGGGVRRLAAPGAVGYMPATGLGSKPPLLAHVGVLMDLLHLSSILGASGLVYTWPRALQRFIAALSLTPLGTSRWVALDCVLPDRPAFPRSFGALLAIALPALAYVLVAVALWGASMRVDVPRVGAKPLVALIATAGLYFPLLAWSALSTLQCVPLDGPAPPGQEALARGALWAFDTGVQCWRGPHLGLVLGFGVPVLLGLGVGWLALLAALLRHCSSRLEHRADTAASQRRARRRPGRVQ